MSFRNKKPVKQMAPASQGASKAPVDKFQHGSSSMNMKKQLLYPPGLGPQDQNLVTWRLQLARLAPANPAISDQISIFTSSDGSYKSIRHVPDEPFVNEMIPPDRPTQFLFPDREDYKIAMVEYNVLYAEFKLLEKREASETKIHMTLTTKFIADEEVTRQHRPVAVSFTLDFLSDLSVEVILREMK